MQQGSSVPGTLRRGQFGSFHTSDVRTDHLRVYVRRVNVRRVNERRVNELCSKSNSDYSS